MRPPRSPPGDQLTVAYGGASHGCLWHLAAVQPGGPTLVGRTFAYRPLIGCAFRRSRPPAGVRRVSEGRGKARATTSDTQIDDGISYIWLCVGSPPDLPY